jgi:PAS domain S-box-containing protein
MNTRDRLSLNRWTILSLAVVSFIAVVDWAGGRNVTLINLLVAGPLLESVRGTPRRSLMVGAYALVLAVLLGAANGILGTGDHWVRCAAVAAGGALAVWAASVRQSAEREAVRGQERLRAAIENSADGLLLLDRDAVIRYASQSTLRLLGFAPAELLGTNGFDLIHPDDVDGTRALFGQCLANAGVPVAADYRCRHKDGTWRDVSGVAVNRLDEPANAAIVVNYRDVTAAKRASEELQESARLLQEAKQFNDEIISGAGEGIIVYNRVLRYAAWNRFMEDLTGLKAEKVLGHHPLELFPFLRAQGLYPLLERALAGETVTSEDVRFTIPQTRRTGWVSSTYAPHRNASAEIVGVIGLVRDVSKRKEAEGQLKASEDKYRNIFHFAPIGIYEALGDGRLLAVNRALARMLGYASSDELLAVNLRDIYDDAADRDSIIGRYEEGGVVRGVEVLWKRKDGTPLWVELHFHAKKDERAWSRNREGFVLDISERKRTGLSVREQLSRSVSSYPRSSAG